jgi:hypothetical protein
MDKAHQPDEQIAERYFLGELTDAEAEAYEAHYFECERCAEYVAEEMQMLESGRAVAMMDARPAAPAPVTNIAEGRRRKRDWIPLAAAAVLVIAVGAPMLLRGPVKPEPAMIALVDSGVELEFSMKRNAAAPVTLQADAWNVVTFTVPPFDGVKQVELSIRETKTNKIIIKPRQLSAEELSGSFQLVLGPLPAGTCEAVIEGVREDGNRSTIASQIIEVRR